MKTQNEVYKWYITGLIIAFLFPLNFVSAQITSFNLVESGTNALTFKEKGEVKVLYLFLPKNQGHSYQVGFSPFKRLSFDLGLIQSNLTSTSERHGEIKKKGINFYASSGFYTSINLDRNKAIKESINLSLKFGYSVGKFDTTFERAYTNFTYRKWFYQFGIGYSFKNWRIDMFSKLYEIDFIEGDVFEAHLLPGIEENVNTLENESNFRMQNDRVQITCGFGYVNFIIGISNDRNREKLEKYNFLSERSTYFGLIINVDQCYKKVFKKL